MPSLSVFCSDGKCKFPVAEKQGESLRDLLRGVVGAGRFSRHPVEFKDLEFPSQAEGFGRLVAHVIASDEESMKRLRDPVNGSLLLLRTERHAIAEEASLGVVSGLNETECLPLLKHVAPSLVESSQQCLRLVSSTLIPQNELLDGLLSIADDLGKCFSVMAKILPFSAPGNR